MAAAISAAAPSPCTRVGTTSTSAPRHRRPSTCRKSRIAAPVGLVTTAIRRTNGGSGRLRAGSNSPSLASFSRSCRRASSSAPMPRGSIVLDDQLIAAARGVDVEVPAADHLQAVVQVEPHARGGAPPHRRAELGAVVFEREIAVARLRPGEVRDLARHPDRRETRLQQVLDLGRQFPDGKHLALAAALGENRSRSGMGHRELCTAVCRVLVMPSS